MGNCKDCKWWQDHDTPTTYSKWPPGHWRACMLTHTLSNEPEDHPDTRAIACEWEDYQGVLFTAPDFGCVQFEAIQ